jgi:hypothetical protein
MKAGSSVPRALRAVGAAALAALLAVACEPSTAVPDGAQVVRVVATDQAVTLTPDSVRAATST